MLASLEAVVRQTFENLQTTYQLPGLVLVVGHADEPAISLRLGTDAAGAPLLEESLFPVASITKLATALTVLRLVDAGLLTLDTPLSDLLPEAAAAQAGVTLRTLLSHTSGLPSGRPDDAVAWTEQTTWPKVTQAWLRTPLAAAPQTRVDYSNVGYGLLGLAVERLTGEPFPMALHTQTIEPLGIEAYLGVEPPRIPALIADPSTSYPPSISWWNSEFWRSFPLPYTNLVTTAAGTLALIRAFQDVPAKFLHADTCAEATHNQVGQLGGGFTGIYELGHCPWGLGPSLSLMRPFPSATANHPSFGHAGLTGCIAWADPAVRVAWAILGTRMGDNGWTNQAFPAISAAILAAFE